ncbi:MAG: ABC transporter ATP-binding protein [Tissierellia bacterium]|nr:ABC transporter ATP-binding protein [Tissierellia bacterium]
MREKKPLLSIEDLVIKFQLKDQIVEVIKGLSLNLYKGESLAIVGESGAGKSVLVKSLIGVLDKNGWIDAGKILYKGMDIAKFKSEDEWLKIRGKEIAMVFQEPMTALNPLRTIGSQVEEAIVLHQGLRGREARKEAIRILEDVGIKDADKLYKRYPHEFSGGMRQRVVIAIALACKPQILICDEPTTALDVTIQAQILKLLNRLQEEYNLTILYISHDLGVVAKVAHRVAVMYKGKIIEVGNVKDIFYRPKDPYTISLLSKLP